MAIPVQCTGCQAHFAAPEALAGKRAKCKQCGTVVSVPALPEIPTRDSATAGLTLLSELAPEPSPQPSPQPVPTPTPVPRASSGSLKLHHASAATQIAPQPVAAPVRAADPVERSPIPSRFWQIAPIALTLLMSFVTAVTMSLLIGGFVGWLLAAAGMVVAIMAALFGMVRVPVAAWAFCVVYCLVCVFLGGAYTLVQMRNQRLVALSRGIQEAEQAARREQHAPPLQPSPFQETSRSTPAANSQAVPLPVPVAATPKYPWPMAKGTPPWRVRPGSEELEDEGPIPPGPRKLAEAKIRFLDWQVEADPAPQPHLIGEGTDLTITVPYSVRGDDVYLPGSYGSALAFNDQRKNEIEVWDLQRRQRLARILLPGSGYVTGGSISPDGSYVAAYLTILANRNPSTYSPYGSSSERTDTSQSTLRVWSTLDPTKDSDIPLDGNGRPDSFGFASTDIVYLARGAATTGTRPGETKAQRPAEVKLYDAATGTLRSTLDLTNITLAPSHLMPTPGGRYLLMTHGQPVFWDTATGRIAGKIKLPKRWNCESASLPAKGDQIAMLLFDDEHKSHFGVWDMRTHELKLAHDDGERSLSNFGSFSNQQQIAWLNNDEGWICQGRQLNATGEAEAQFSYPLSMQYARKLFDSNLLLTGESLSNDFKSLRLGKFEAARLKPVAIGNRSNLLSYEAFPDAMERSEHRNAGAVPLPYEELLAGEPDSWRKHWNYCAALQRPTVGLRWGVGINLDVGARNAQGVLEPQFASRDGLQWLSREAGPVGLQLVDALRRRGEAGQWGKFVDINDTRLREVVILGGGTRAQLNNSARIASVDVAVLIRLENVVKGRDKDISMTLEIVDMATNKKVWESKPLLSSKVAQVRERGQDPITELVATAGDFIDKQLVLTPLSTMPRAMITTRAETTPLHRCNAMAALAELMLYDHHKTITKEVALAAFQKLVGKETEAQVLVGADLAAKRELIEKYQVEW